MIFAAALRGLVFPHGRYYLTKKLEVVGRRIQPNEEVSGRTAVETAICGGEVCNWRICERAETAALRAQYKALVVIGLN